MSSGLQASRGQHLSGDSGGRIGQEQDGDPRLLRDDLAGEAGPDRGVSGATDQPRHLSGQDRAGRHRDRGHGSGNTYEKFYSLKFLG